MANIYGTNGNDVPLSGTNDHDFMAAFRGNDALHGHSGFDFMSGGADHDNLFGYAGNDVLNGDPGNDILSGQAGDDRLSGDTGNDLFIYGSTEGNDTIRDFAGNDQVNLTEATSAQIQAVYGNTIAAGDVGVSNVGGDLVIDFGAAPGSVPFPGFGDLIFDNLGANGLTVGVHIV
jgi:Ca2+-binding RTX toxin-like protein